MNRGKHFNNISICSNFFMIQLDEIYVLWMFNESVWHDKRKRNDRAEKCARLKGKHFGLCANVLRPTSLITKSRLNNFCCQQNCVNQNRNAKLFQKLFSDQMSDHILSTTALCDPHEPEKCKNHNNVVKSIWCVQFSNNSSNTTVCKYLNSTFTRVREKEKNDFCLIYWARQTTLRTSN